MRVNTINRTVTVCVPMFVCRMELEDEFVDLDEAIQTDGKCGFQCVR